MTLPGSPTRDGAGRWPSDGRERSFASIVQSETAPDGDGAGRGQTTWEDVACLPYRTRRIDRDGGSGTVEVVDRWNDPDDPAFLPYWNEKKKEEEEEAEKGLREIMVTETGDEEKVCEDDELDPDRRAEGMYIVCYHLPVTVSRDDDGAWSAVW